MCFIKKMNCIWIRKREDRVLDPVRTTGWVLGPRVLTRPNFACSSSSSALKIHVEQLPKHQIYSLCDSVSEV